MISPTRKKIVFCNFYFFFLKFVIATKAEGTGRGRGGGPAPEGAVWSSWLFEVWKTSAEDPLDGTTVTLGSWYFFFLRDLKRNWWFKKRKTQKGTIATFLFSFLFWREKADVFYASDFLNCRELEKMQSVQTLTKIITVNWLKTRVYFSDQIVYGFTNVISTWQPFFGNSFPYTSLIEYLTA